MIEFQDGALMVQVGPNYMRHAIGYALNHHIRSVLPVERLDFAQIGQLTFLEPDLVGYPALGLARDITDIGGLVGAAFIGAKEMALDAFIAGQIRFTDMTLVVAEVIEIMTAERLGNAAITLESVTEVDQMARRAAGSAIKKQQR